MNDPQPINKSFSQIIPDLQLAHDASSIKIGKACWRKYKYQQIDGYQSSASEGIGSRGVPNPHLVFGHLFHAATEFYDKLRVKDINHQSALRETVKCLFFNTFDWVHKIPWPSEVAEKTQKTLIRTVINYLDKFENEDKKVYIRPNGTPAVELSFSFELNLKSRLTGEDFLLCGHIDKVIIWNENLWIVDKKSTKYALDDNYFKQYSPDVQVTLYCTAGQMILGEPIKGMFIDGAQVQVNGSRFRRREIPRSPEHFDEFLTEMEWYLEELEKCIERDYWPMRETSCGFGAVQCPYRMVCSANPLEREDLLNNYFVKIPKRWDPIQTR